MSNNTGPIDKNKLLVIVGRQLDTELRLLNHLEKICNCFTANALESVSDNTGPPKFQFLEEQLEKFRLDVAATVASRKTILGIMADVEAVDVSNVSIRRLLQTSAEPWRTQLEDKRLAIVNRIYDLKIQLAGDSAAVFYSYDFYRRIVNSLIGNSSEETEYRNDGKSIGKNSGKLYEKGVLAMSLFIGLSAIRTSQTGLDVTSQNIANASTPGYHRQNVHLEALSDNLFRGRRIGSGVSVTDLERVRFSIVESFLTETTSDFERANQSLAIQRQIESFLLPGEGSLQGSLESLFNDITSLAGSPSDQAARNQAVQSGVLVANRFRELANTLQGIRESIVNQIDAELTTLNSDIQRLSSLNQEIVTARAVGGLPNELLDQRDQTINAIAERVDVSRIDFADGSVSLTFGNYSIQRSVTDVTFSTTESQNGAIALSFDGGARDLQLSSGRISALIDSYNQLIPSQLQQLDELAENLIRSFDQVHATGIGVNGSFENVIGNRPVNFPNTTLNESGIAFPVEAGRLYFSIIEPNGNRRTEFIDVDPETQSLVDIATEINSLDNLNANVNSQTNQLQISSSPGFQFDFTGTQESIPDLAGVSGSAIPQFDGIFAGESNTELNFEIEGSGSVGIANNLNLVIRGADGSLIETVNLGAGYEAGTRIEIAEGVSLSIPPGTLNDGDAFSTTLISTPDETGILSSLGINSFFVGRDASTIGVDSRIENDPSQFAASETGDTAEANKINQFIELSESRFLDGGRLTFSEYLIEFTTEVGVNVQVTESLTNNLQELVNEYEQQRDSISGVDVNEEFVRLTQYQNSFEAAVRVIQTSETVLDELFSLIR